MPDTPLHPRPHRLRRVAKWAGTAACFLLAGLWLASRWRWPVVDVVTPRGLSSVGIEGGLLSYHYQAQSAGFSPGWSVDLMRASRPAWGWFPYSWSRPGSAGTGLPLWLPFLLIVIPTVALFRLDRRRFAPGRCQRCGYDLAGLAKGTPCPECGKGASA